MKRSVPPTVPPKINPYPCKTKSRTACLKKQSWWYPSIASPRNSIRCSVREQETLFLTSLFARCKRFRRAPPGCFMGLGRGLVAKIMAGDWCCVRLGALARWCLCCSPGCRWSLPVVDCVLRRRYALGGGSMPWW